MRSAISCARRRAPTGSRRRGPTWWLTRPARRMAFATPGRSATPIPIPSPYGSAGLKARHGLAPSDATRRRRSCLRLLTYCPRSRCGRRARTWRVQTSSLQLCVATRHNLEPRILCKRRRHGSSIRRPDATIDISGGDGSTPAIALEASQGPPPYRWAVDGVPLPKPPIGGVMSWAPDGPGFAQISVTDGNNRSASEQNSTSVDAQHNAPAGHIDWRQTPKRAVGASLRKVASGRLRSAFPERVVGSARTSNAGFRPNFSPSRGDHLAPALPPRAGVHLRRRQNIAKGGSPSFEAATRGRVECAKCGRSATVWRTGHSTKTVSARRFLQPCARSNSAFTRNRT